MVNGRMSYRELVKILINCIMLWFYLVFCFMRFIKEDENESGLEVIKYG